MANKYEIEARYIPAIVCSIPFIALGFYFIGRIDLSFWQTVFAVGIGGLTMSIALFKSFNFICRMLGKLLEEKLFNNGLDFPTTSFLLDDDHEFSPERKVAIISRIKAEFNVDLKAKTKDTENNRRHIHETIGYVRNLHFKNDGVLLQRNIYFGFSKNMAGGSIAASIASLACIVLSIITSSAAALKISVLLLIIYGLSIAFFVAAMRFTSKHYALSLFDEFLGS
jgi:hypothetical protein